MWQLPEQSSSDKYFYHVTTKSKWSDILQSGGIQAGSYFAVREIADYYEECVEDEGEDPFVIAVEYVAFERTMMDLDRPGLDEPVCFSAFGLRDNDVYKAWDSSDGTVEACIALIGSFKYNEKIPLNYLKPLRKVY